MTDDEATGKREDAVERRVYNLPRNLLERLRAYQKASGITAESEAARRLLDYALQKRDTVRDILNTLEDRFAEERDIRVLAAEVLAKHARVTRVIFEPGEVSFDLETNDRGRITSDGKLFWSDSLFHGDHEWSAYDRKLSEEQNRRPVARPAPTPSESEFDDEIPF